jgi:REP element-mobilizing transposase RayT
VTLRAVSGLSGLRSDRVANSVGRAIRNAKRGHAAFRVLHFSIQTNHLHLIVEADDRLTLTRGMQGLAIRAAKAINRVLGRAGRVFADRYHAHTLMTPREVRRGIAYVLLNHRKHDRSAHGVDPCSSGRWFGGWSIETTPSSIDSPVSRPATWLAAVGWRKHGLISPSETPGRATHGPPR